MNISKFLFAVSLFVIVSCSSDDDKDTTEQQQIGETNGYQYVDLGLSVKWATCNVGATSPYDTGNLYAWGEVSPKEEYLSTNLNTGQTKGISPNIARTVTLVRLMD